MAKDILIVDDEANMRSVLEIVVSREGHSALTAGTGEQALRHLKRSSSLQMILCDVRLPDMDGIELLKMVQTERPGIPVILITAYGTIDLAVRAMKLGAADFLTKPVTKDGIRRTINRVLADAGNGEGTRPGLGSLGTDVVAVSKPMKSVLEICRKVARYKTSVLVLGESGSGKELVARSIHAFDCMWSGEPDRPYLSISCPTLPETLFESELFGHKKGAFTGASADYPGKLRQAENGTLFLDEIGDLPMRVQPKLLRFLEERSFQPIGSNTECHVNTRLVSATNLDLSLLVEQGNFRRDLLYRINTLTIEVPPLRERTEDILPLARHFLTRYSRDMKRFPLYLSPPVENALLNHPWPGNVRELRNVIEQAVVLSTGREVVLKDLPPELRGYGILNRREAADADRLTISFGSNEGRSNGARAQNLDDIERRHILEILRRNQWNVSASARALGISRNRLRYRIAKHGLAPPANGD